MKETIFFLLLLTDRSLREGVMEPALKRPRLSSADRPVTEWDIDAVCEFLQEIGFQDEVPLFIGEIFTCCCTFKHLLTLFLRAYILANINNFSPSRISFSIICLGSFDGV